VFRQEPREDDAVVLLGVGPSPTQARRTPRPWTLTTRIDWAHCIKELVDVHYPDAERIVLVQDNLNTHTPASLYEAFAPAEARRLADRLELHYTPGKAAG
jgi:hypothetical protein